MKQSTNKVEFILDEYEYFEDLYICLLYTSSIIAFLLILCVNPNNLLEILLDSLTKNGKSVQ